MKIKTRGRYGLRAMFDLALNYRNGPIALTYIANRQAISVHYLERIIAPLKRAGLVTGVRGAQGGYMLAKPPDMITVGIILKTLEDPLTCADISIKEAPSAQNYCVVKVIYKKINDSVTAVMNSITLKDMINEYNENIGDDLKDIICVCKK